MIHPENFPNPLDLRVQPDGFHYLVLKTFSVEDQELGTIEVRPGFITDLGSIPRIFWNIIPPNGKPTEAYVIHDWLYYEQRHNRAESDACLRRMMKALGVGWLERWVVYLAVRLGGGFAWRADARKYRRKI